jgi:hypothetical protein
LETIMPNRDQFEADAIRVLLRFRPKLNRFGLPVTAVPLGFDTSATGCPVRRYRDPRNGRVLIFGLDRAAHQRGRIKILQIA